MAKKIIYFTAGFTPTTTEAAEIALLNNLGGNYNIAVRNGAESASFGYGIETSDFVAGTIPTAFNAVPVYAGIHADKPTAFKILASVTLAALATKQLYPIIVTGNDLTALNASLLTANVTYASSVAAKATVDANGLITAVATGATVITATYTYASGKTITATCAVTVS